MDGEDGESTGTRRRRSKERGPATPRLEDVARRARVSTATVSRVLNRPSAVKPELRESVQRAVEALGYVPHGPARALASRRSNTIGAVIPTVDNAIFASSVQALQSRLYDAGLTLLLASSDYDEERERRQVQSLVERGIDGLILVGERRDAAIYDLLELKRIPYVNTWIYDDASPHACIGFDNRRGAERIAGYVLDIGHREIAMVAGITQGNDRAAERVEGVHAA
ncbi:MAG: LacI family DNA-binding transcriptional regulator, partial [Gammaproteobacteria bacterium]|nr:LacI family DNA-binding transcriptional regulator [Gammaproteobacteria bacterium]